MLTRCIDSVVSVKLQKVDKTSHAKIARLKLLELLIFGYFFPISFTICILVRSVY